MYLGRSHLCKSLFVAILGRRKKSLRNTALDAEKKHFLHFFLQLKKLSYKVIATIITR